MNNDQFEDLKQFIDSRISQSEETFDHKLDEKLNALRKEMLDGFAGVGEAIENVHKQLDETKSDFETRLSKLEQQAA
jgi:ABC-type transporter Mla subunit MlaD